MYADIEVLRFVKKGLVKKETLYAHIMHGLITMKVS